MPREATVRNPQVNWIYMIVIMWLCCAQSTATGAIQQQSQLADNEGLSDFDVESDLVLVWPRPPWTFSSKSTRRFPLCSTFLPEIKPAL